MNLPWTSTRRWLAVCLAAASVSVVHPLAAESTGSDGSALPVSGENIEGDAPTPYRLPLVGLCEPEDEARITGEPTTAAVPGTVTPAEAKAAAPVVAARIAAKPRAAFAPVPFPANTAGLTAQLLPAVQRGFNLAQRGAFFAARTEFIQVLRRVAQAKDAAAGTNEFSTALAAGLRAMDEADDFVPAGAQLEGELDVRGVASSHRTPVLRDEGILRSEMPTASETSILPQDAVAKYHQFAQQQLSRAALDEQAGSMALYGLGKVYSQLAERRDDDVQCTRGAMTMYCAALDACPNNNLAANELGVLLCRSGRTQEAIESFTRAIDIAPTATAYHNLAFAQQRLGMLGQAAANEQESQRLAALERCTGALSRRAGIEWVTPDVLAGVSQPAALTPATTDPAIANRPTLPPKHKWR
jgi:tetratricopeptide (TPR) repeat protein